MLNYKREQKYLQGLWDEYLSGSVCGDNSSNYYDLDLCQIVPCSQF